MSVQRPRALLGQGDLGDQTDPIPFARILTGFQKQEPPSNTSPTCEADCAARDHNNFLAECTHHFGADCADDCVLVCERPHADDNTLCCDKPLDACQNEDCYYAKNEPSCCVGCMPCPINPNTECRMVSTLGYTQYHGGIVPTHFTCTLNDNYHCFSQQELDKAYADSGLCTDQEHDEVHYCHQNMAQCPYGMPSNFCSPPATSPFGMSSDAGYCSWNLSPADTPISTRSQAAFECDISPEQEHYRLHVASDNTMPSPHVRDSSFSGQDINPMGSVGNMPNSQNLHLQDYHNDLTLENLSQTLKVNQPFDSTRSSNQNMLCMWMVHGDESQKMCSCSFSTRESLHHHILEDHVKPMKRRGSNSIGIVPVCRWRDCESAKIKKPFKLQHLKDHIVCHSKIRLKCDQCGKECRDAKVLKLHMNSHIPGKEKPFACDEPNCNARFGTSALLSSHKRVHTGEKPHKCNWCEYRAADKGNLRRHEEEMHMGKKWPCPYCGQQLAKKANLTRHIRDLHPHGANSRTRGQEQNGQTKMTLGDLPLNGVNNRSDGQEQNGRQIAAGSTPQ